MPVVNTSSIHSPIIAKAVDEVRRIERPRSQVAVLQVMKVRFTIRVKANMERGLY